jgi:hypothetical protein
MSLARHRFPDSVTLTFFVYLPLAMVSYSKNDVTVRFSDPISFDGLLEFFMYLLPFKGCLSVLIWLEIWHSGSKIWGF